MDKHHIFQHIFQAFYWQLPSSIRFHHSWALRRLCPSNQGLHRPPGVPDPGNSNSSPQTCPRNAMFWTPQFLILHIQYIPIPNSRLGEIWLDIIPTGVDMADYGKDFTEIHQENSWCWHSWDHQKLRVLSENVVRVYHAIPSTVNGHEKCGNWWLNNGFI